MEETFIAVHDQCLRDWYQATKSGDIGDLSNYPSDDYQGFFGYKGISNVTPTSKEEAVAGLKQLLAYVSGADHNSLNRQIKMRSEEEAVVSYERNITKQDKINMNFLILQTWRSVDGNWKIVREVAENI